MKVADYCLILLLRMCSLIQLVSWVNSRLVFCTTTLTHLTMETLRCRVLIHSWTVLGYWAIEIPLRMNTTHFFLSSNLSDTMQNWPHIYIRYFNSLITLNFKFFTYYFRWSLNCQWFLRTTFSIGWSSHDRLTILLWHIVVFS